MCTEKILPLRLVHPFAWFPHLRSPMGNPFVLFVFNAMHMILKRLYEIQEKVYLLSPPQKQHMTCTLMRPSFFLLIIFFGATSLLTHQWFIVYLMPPIDGHLNY